MPNARALWAKLPKFMRTHQTVRTNMLQYNEYFDKEKKQDQFEERPITEANIITSLDTTGYGSAHRPVLDLDFDAALLPSSTEGHHHLFIDKLMSTDDYYKLLDVMAEVGLLEQGYVDASKQRSATAVRLPWISKDSERDNAFNPDEHDDTIAVKIARLKEKIKALEKGQAWPF
jgi:hypothetical protein